MSTYKLPFTNIPVWFDVNQDSLTQTQLDDIASGDLIYIEIVDGVYDTIVTSGSSYYNYITIAGTVQPLKVKGAATTDALFIHSNNVEIRAGDGSDSLSIYGDGCTVYLGPGAGGDLITAYAAITIKGGPGRDNIGGSDFGDTLFGGDGTDYIAGGAGDDVIRLGPNAPTDHLYYYEWAWGQDGDDLIYGGAGIDLLHGDHDANVLPTSVPGRDTLFGGEGDDRLHGGGASDRLFGGSGNDILAGERGNDVLKGGAGADVFYFSNTETIDSVVVGLEDMGHDKIKDFVQGEDSLGFRYRDPVTKVWSTSDDFTWRADAGLLSDGTELQIAYQTKSDKTRVLFDQDGDGNAELTFDLVGFTDALIFDDLEFFENYFLI
ncbi:MAG: calcium-binding protein [Rhodobacteraceae bacterium]|nr:calcium-binding protein [Paracoccaceae bacterium]